MTNSESDNRLLDIADVTSDWYWEMGPDLRYSYVSGRFFEETGIKKENFIGKERTDFIGPDFIQQNPKLWKAHQEDLKHHRPFYNFEYYRREKNGHQRYIRVSGKPFFDEKGTFIGYRGAASCITEQKLAEEALQASEQRFRDFAESSSDWLWEMGPDLRFSYFSEGNQFITGLAPETVIGKTRQELVVDGEDPEKWKGHLDDLENHRVFKHFQYEIKLPDGSTKHISISGKPVFDDVGEFMGYRGTGSDMTSQLEAERRASSAQTLLMDAIESIPSMMFLLDADDRYVMCNQTYRETLGIMEDLLVPGTPFEEFCRAAVERGMVDGFQDNPDEWVRLRIARIHTPHEPILHQQRDGRWVLTADHKTNGGGTLIVRTDVTELMRTQKQLQSAKEEAEIANRTKSEFLANMSHELRTPLNAIIGFSDSILCELFGPIENDKYKGYVGDINKSGIHLLELINDILDVSVIEAGKLELQKESLEIGSIIKASVRLVVSRAERGRVGLKIDVDDDIPALYADKRRMKQILLNLLSNAIKFTPQGGTVLVAAHFKDAKEILLSVTDTGVGMDEQGIAKSLEEFGRSTGSEASGIEGTGLGLPLTIGLVEAHGGTLDIESSPKNGTKVTVRFPVK